MYELSQKLTFNNIIQAVVYILDEKALSIDLKVPDNLIISTALGIHKTYMSDIEKAFEKNIKIIKILPYDQGILRSDYQNILEVAEFVEEKGMVLTICSTYGSKLLYDTNGIELAVFLKKKTDIPIILAHGGGPKVFDAMSIALDYEDIFLDLSFSLKFWWGSSVIKDYAFVLKKLEFKRCFYGSDYPYVDFDESIRVFLKFAEKYVFSEDVQENILYRNFIEFKSVYL